MSSARRRVGPYSSEPLSADTMADVAQAENLKLTVSDDATTVIAEGEIDSHTSQALDKALSAVAAAETLSLNLAAVSFINSSGLRVIVHSHRRHRDGGGQLVIESPSEAVVRLLEITGLTSQLHIGLSPAP